MADAVADLQKIPLTEEPAVQVTPPTTTPPATPAAAKSMPKTSKRSSGLVAVLALVIILAGVGTGYAMAQLVPKGGSASSSSATVTPTTGEDLEVGKTYGMENGDKFPDTVEGILVMGGIEGEGSHHLIRPGGKSQIVYLTSSVIDLDTFVGTKVAIKGETFQAQKAGWLLDVGQVKVLELNVANPEAEVTPEVPAE